MYNSCFVRTLMIPLMLPLSMHAQLIDTVPSPPDTKINETKEERIYRVAEEMPRFPGCEDLPSEPMDRAKYRCAQKNLLEFVYSQLRYPDDARVENIEGNVVVQFIVEKDGSITNVKCARDIGFGCGEEAVRLINLMKSMNEKWTPGRIHGTAVRIEFTLPVTFKL